MAAVLCRPGSYVASASFSESSRDADTDRTANRVPAVKGRGVNRSEIRRTLSLLFTGSPEVAWFDGIPLGKSRDAADFLGPDLPVFCKKICY